MPERFDCTSLAKKALYKYSSFPFLFENQTKRSAVLIADNVADGKNCRLHGVVR